DRMGASALRLRRLGGGRHPEAAVRPVLHQAPVAGARPVHRVRDGEDRRAQAGIVVKNAGQAPIVNAMSVDVEDHFHVSALAAVAPRHRWEYFAPRVVDTTLRLLDIFAAADTKATFFILGWVAARHVDLVRRIAAGGHDTASHRLHHTPGWRS